MVSRKIKTVLDYIEHGYITEYQFDKHYGKRLWRSDFCIPKYGILIEAEGIFFNNSGISRHQQGQGFSADLSKYNEANILGFQLLRHSQLTIIKADLENEINLIVKRVVENTYHDFKCSDCEEILYVPKNLWLKTENGFRCLTCQWIIDDKLKIKKLMKKR